MASDINMSLEDIIQKKKSFYRNNKMDGNSSQPIKRNFITKAQNRIDARNKIISKKRNHITDAREKLAELAKQRDARQKLDQLRAKRINLSQSARIPFNVQKQREKPAVLQKKILQRNAVFLDPTRQVRSQQNKIHTGRQIGLNKLSNSRSTKLLPPLKPIVRTVENDVMINEDDELMMEYKPIKTPALGRKASLNLKIIAHNTDLKEKNSGVSKRYLDREKEKSPPRLTSILKKRPMAALRSEKQIEKPETTRVQSEYRIIVSNLGNTVTGSDIQELFGDVGGLLESRLVRPGTAEVIYKSLEDAQKAVDLYHNRQLDGQPMNCLLVSPRSAAPTSLRSSNKTSLPPSTNSNVEPDLNTFHKVLFSNF